MLEGVIFVKRTIDGHEGTLEFHIAVHKRRNAIWDSHRRSYIILEASLLHFLKRVCLLVVEIGSCEEHRRLAYAVSSSEEGDGSLLKRVVRPKLDILDHVVVVEVGAVA